MTDLQRLVAGCGLVAVVLLLVFAPFTVKERYWGDPPVYVPEGMAKRVRSPIFSAPATPELGGTVSLDSGELLLELVIVAVVAGGAVMVSGARR